MPPVSNTIPPEEDANGLARLRRPAVAAGHSTVNDSCEPSLLESPRRIHLILFLAARKALIATEQLSAPHAEYMNA